MKRSKKNILNDHATVYHCVKNGQPVKRDTAKDGSIPTRPVVPCPDLPESEVLKQCLSWLKKHRVFCNRHEVGAGNISGAGYATYGIKGGGDIIGLLASNRGCHFEVECKAGKGGRLSKEQQQRQNDIYNNGGYYFIVHGIPELEYYFRGLV
jgi:hypothetical protein